MRKFVPQIGLSDGLIHIMYEAHMEKMKAAKCGGRGDPEQKR